MAKQQTLRFSSSPSYEPEDALSARAPRESDSEFVHLLQVAWPTSWIRGLRRRFSTKSIFNGKTHKPKDNLSRDEAYAVLLCAIYIAACAGIDLIPHLKRDERRCIEQRISWQELQKLLPRRRTELKDEPNKQGLPSQALLGR